MPLPAPSRDTAMEPHTEVPGHTPPLTPSSEPQYAETELTFYGFFADLFSPEEAERSAVLDELLVVLKASAQAPPLAPSAASSTESLSTVRARFGCVRCAVLCCAAAVLAPLSVAMVSLVAWHGPRQQDGDSKEEG